MQSKVGFTLMYDTWPGNWIFNPKTVFIYILIQERFFVFGALSPWCLCQIYVQCCLHFCHAIELSIETLFPYYKYIFAQKISCLHTFTIHVHNTKSKKKQCLNCWLYECTLLDKESLDLKPLVKAMSSKVRWLVDFS